LLAVSIQTLMAEIIRDLMADMIYLIDRNR
jgi:hypothetical protein